MVAAVGVVVSCPCTVTAQQAGNEEISLRSRFGFDPLKRQPLVVVYRMDLAGNANGGGFITPRECLKTNGRH
jgi:hypothetical protein